MTQEEKNKVFALSKNINNVKVLMEDLLYPIKKIQTKYNCSQEKACDFKLKAEQYLTEYGILLLDSTYKALNKITSTRNV